MECGCKGGGRGHVPSIRREQQLATVAQGQPEGSRRGGGGRAREEGDREEAGGDGVHGGRRERVERRRCPHEKMGERATGPARFPFFQIARGRQVILLRPADYAPPCHVAMACQTSKCGNTETHDF